MMKKINTFFRRLACVLMLLGWGINLLAEISISNVQPSAPTDCTGSIKIISNGTAGPFVIKIIGYDFDGDILNITPGEYSGSDLQLNLTALCPGNYIITINDALGCEKIFHPTIEVDCTMVNMRTSATISPTCLNGSSGSISINKVEGSKAPYRFLWDNGSTASHRQQLVAGNYMVTITDEYGCTDVEQFTVEGELQQVVFISEQSNSCVCAEGSGAIRVNVSGGLLPYQFQWTGPGGFTANTKDLIGISQPGNYHLSVIDANGCGGGFSTVVNACVDAFALEVEVLNKVCLGNETGIIQIHPIGANNPPFTYMVHNLYGEEVANSGNPIVGGLAVGSYTITVIDALGCEVQTFYNLAPTTPFAINASIENICEGGTGSIRLNILEVGEPGEPYSYKWHKGYLPIGQNSAILDNITAGTYSVTVTNNGGCQVQKSYIIHESLVRFEAEVENDCKGKSGSISVEVTEGLAPFDFLWSNGKTGSVINQLEGGTYTLTITDANSCTTTGTFEIFASESPLKINRTLAYGTCSADQNDGYLVAQISGGTPPFSYTWTEMEYNHLNTINIYETGSSNRLENLLPGFWYEVEVEDAYGCSAKGLLETITEPFAIGANTILGDDPQTSAGEGAIRTQIVTDGYIPGPGNSQHEPFTYHWSNGVTSAHPEHLVAGNYKVTVTDAAGCYAYASFDIPSCAGTLGLKPMIEFNRCLADDDLGNGQFGVRIITEKVLTFKWSGPQSFIESESDYNTTEVSFLQALWCSHQRACLFEQQVTLPLNSPQ